MNESMEHIVHICSRERFWPLLTLTNPKNMKYLDGFDHISRCFEIPTKLTTLEYSDSPRYQDTYSGVSEFCGSSNICLVTQSVVMGEGMKRLSMLITICSFNTHTPRLICNDFWVLNYKVII